MIVRMLKDWGGYATDQIVEIYDPVGKSWLLDGVAVLHTPERNDSPVETASVPLQKVEAANRRHVRK